MHVKVLRNIILVSVSYGFEKKYQIYSYAKCIFKKCLNLVTCFEVY